MPNYIDKDKLVRDLIDNRSFYPALVKRAIENAPVITIDEDYAIQCTCYALGCQQAEQIETKAKQEVAKQIFEEIENKFHDDDFGDWVIDFMEYQELKEKYIGEQ